MAETITRADIAEIYESLDDPRAPLARVLANDEHAAERERASEDTRTMDRLWAWLDHGQPDGDKASVERGEILAEIRQITQ